MEAAIVSIRVCSVATTAVAAGVALCGKVIYTALSCVCHRGRLEQLRLLRTAELALDTKVTHGVFPRSRPSSDTAAVCVVAAVLFILVCQSQGLKMFVYHNFNRVDRASAEITSDGSIWPVYVAQCYLFWYDNHKGWKILSTTTVNRNYSVGWKHFRRFYLAPLRWCAHCQQQNWNWGRAWLVNVKSSTPRKMEALLSYRGHLFSQICVSISHREQHRQQLWWHH